MHRAVWIAKKHHLCSLIKQISDWYDGDEVEWLRDYCREIIHRHDGVEILTAIDCFTDVLEQIKKVPRGTWRMSDATKTGTA